VTKKPKQFLRFKQVKERYGDAPTSSLYEQMKQCRFPRPMQLAPGSRVRLWDVDELDAHDAAQLAARDGRSA
jgi:predicted DNA-binding transcriptional regulator AlpA